MIASAVAVAMAAGAYAVIAPGGTGIPAARAADGVVADDGAREVDFTEDWKFHLATRTPTVADIDTLTLEDEDISTAEAVSPDFDDADWRTVTVPHDFSIEGDKVAEGSNSQAYLQGGLGWYRKSFSVPESLRVAGKRVVIDFESVYQNSVVYLNGDLVGNYPNGYTGFAYDLTDRLNYGDDRSNTIVVKVQNPAPSSRWYTGSGIVGPVNLVITDPVRFTRHGIDLSTPTLEQTHGDDGSAKLQLSAAVYSDATNGIINVRTTVMDADGKVVATDQSEQVETNPTNLATLNDSITVPDVELWYPWNIGTPYLYTVRTELFYLANGTTETRLVDTVETPFGFRWFDVDPGDPEDPTAGGLHVNGAYTKIHGVDLHHDSGALGAAQHRDAYDRQFNILMSMGVNAYRTAHNPPSKDIIELASEKGIIVVEEAYDGWGNPKAQYDFGRFFLTPVPQDWAGLTPNGLLSPPKPGVDYQGAKYLWSDWVIQEMVKRDRNEPSVFMWSIGNEVRGVGARPTWYDSSKYDVAELGGANNMNEYTEAVRLTEDIKAVDDDRLVIMGGDQQRAVPAWDSGWGRINRYLDGFGLNYNTATSVDQLTERFHSTTFFFESESSSQTSSRGVYLDPKLRNTGINQTPGRRGGSNYDNDFASWTMSNEYGLKKDRDRKSFAGQFIWSGFDYLGEPTPYNVYPVGTSSFGAIDTAGFPKDSYYLFRSQWIDAEKEAQVHLLPSNWNSWRDGEEVDVWVNANVPTVELFLNGESLGRKSFDEKETGYGKKYLETSEPTFDDKTWPTPDGNTGGYSSPGASVLNASGDSVLPDGTNYGRLHLTWKVPFERGVLEARAYDSAKATTPVAVDTVTTAGTPHTIELGASKEVIAADGRSLSYVEATVVDEDGNIVPDADNLLEFDVTGGAIVGVDNGQLESTETYKWGGLERNVHSERSAYAGKALVILQSNAGETGTLKLVARSDGLMPAAVAIAATADGTGEAPAHLTLSPEVVAVQSVGYTVPVGQAPALPRGVRVVHDDDMVGRFEVVRPVTWAAIDPADLAEPGELTVTGTVDGVDAPATAYLSIVAAKDDVDLAVNTQLGADNPTHEFTDLPTDSSLRDGALATATFTGSVSTYPNNMLDGDDATSWSNAYNRGSSVLLPEESRSRPYEFVEFFWDAEHTLDAATLQFVVDASRAVPASFDVEYWDGLGWRDVTGLDTSLDGGQAAFTFDRVTSARVRIGMENATPYTATGNIAITKAEVLGPLLPDGSSKAELRALLDRAGTLEESDYTPASWAPLGAVVDSGETVLVDDEATSEQITSAVTALRAAISQLVKVSAPPTTEPTPTPTPTPTVTQTSEPTTGPTVAPTPSSNPTVTVTATVTTTHSPRPTPPSAVDLYTTPGFHQVNGRQWYTACEPYSQTIRCRTSIWSTQVELKGGQFVKDTGWHFNNLTYLPQMKRAQWGSNPLANPGKFTSAGRQWRTECDTPATGRNACRSYIWTKHVSATQLAGGTWTYALGEDWVFNNIVKFA